MKKPDYQKNHEACDKLSDGEYDAFAKERKKLYYKLLTVPREEKDLVRTEIKFFQNKYGLVPNNDGK